VAARRAPGLAQPAAEHERLTATPAPSEQSSTRPF
jgi:hypothetical protein